jgi:hypothetical protein
MTASAESVAVTLYEFDKERALELGIPPVPIPVRTENAEALFGGASVDIDALVREVDVVIDDDLELSFLYSEVIASLANAAGESHAIKGELHDASEMFRIGLKYRPGSVLLNTKLALALQVQGFLTDASKHYDIALIRRDVPVNAVTLVLAARVRADLSDVAGALDLLDRCPGSMWEDAKFRELYLHYVERIEAG